MKPDEGTLTVAQLIELLQSCENKALPVMVEGCDCSGWASGAEIDPDGCFFIRRFV